MRPALTSLVLFPLLAACPKGNTPEAPAADTSAERQQPAPLEGVTFELPKPSVHQLANGMPVYVVENHEVPMFDIQMVFDIGSFADPEGKEGAAEATFDLLNEGAGERTSADISRDLRQIGSSLFSSADLDGARVGISGLTKNMEQTLDIWTSVLTEPTFPEEDWSVLQSQWLANLEAQRNDPSSVGLRVHYALAYGPTYRGRSASEQTVSAMSTEDIRGFYDTYVGPGNARILVGGDVNPDEVVAALDARIGQWNKAVETTRPEPTPLPVESSVVYFIHEEGASQSVLRLLTPIGKRTDEAYYDLELANRAFGGAFVARVNMNLREDKGWTYGARCFTYYPHGDGFWGCSTSVVTEQTANSMKEILAEIDGALGEKPLTEDEITYMQSSIKNGYPAGFETTNALLAQQVDVQRYGLPVDWTARYLPAIAGVTTEGANAAFAAAVDPNKLSWMVVGDRPSVLEEIRQLGMPIVVLDRDGNTLEELEPLSSEPAEGNGTEPVQEP